MQSPLTIMREIKPSTSCHKLPQRHPRRLGTELSSVLGELDGRLFSAQFQYVEPWPDRLHHSLPFCFDDRGFLPRAWSLPGRSLGRRKSVNLLARIWAGTGGF